MSSCVICVVIAREIFLLQSDCPEITKCITNLKITIKTEILPLNVVDDQAPVVQTSDSTIHRINHYPADSVIDFPNTYPLDSDLSGG